MTMKYNNWETVRLGDVCGYENSRVSIAMLDDDNYISTENMQPNKGGVCRASSLPSVSAATKFLKGQTLVSNIRPYFKKIWFADKDGGCSNDVLCFRLNKDIDNKYFYYLLSQDSFFDYVMSGSKGTKMPRGDRGQIMQFEFLLPPIEEQGRIAGILGALDDKIECNNRINRNLEEQAAVLFRRWFVDFEFPDPDPTSPTYGKPYRSAGGKMQDSPLGSIPKGWQVGTFRDIISSTIGGDWGKESAEANYSQKVYCIRGADITDVSKGEKGKMPFRYILPKNHLAKKLEANDLVLEISGGSPTQSTGRIAIISDSLLKRYDEDMICTNFCRAIKPKAEYAHFIYSLWRYMYDQNIMFSYENGTTGIKNLNINGLIDNEQIIIPPIEVLKSYNNLQKQFFNTIFTNALESETLVTLRNTLLPKLMNNEIKR